MRGGALGLPPEQHRTDPELAGPALKDWTATRSRRTTPTTCCRTWGCSMSAVSDDITADFIIEAQEILDRLGERLVSLEQAQDTERLNAVFRGYHTLKGGAGFLGVTAMVELCHAAEEALGIARARAVLQAHH